MKDLNETILKNEVNNWIYYFNYWINLKLNYIFIKKLHLKKRYLLPKIILLKHNVFLKSKTESIWWKDYYYLYCNKKNDTFLRNTYVSKNEFTKMILVYEILMLSTIDLDAFLIKLI